MCQERADKVVGYSKTSLAIFSLALSCGGAPSPTSASPRTASSAPALTSTALPPAELLHATEGAFVEFEGDPQHTSYEINALARASDGTLYFGGGYYGAITLGGHLLAKRAYETAFLASASSAGVVRWAKTYGTQWHNAINAIRVLDDGRLLVTGTHCNGFSMDTFALADIQRPNAFDAINGFVAAVSIEGKTLFAKNGSDFLAAAKNTSVRAGAIHDADTGYFIELTPWDGDAVLGHLDVTNLMAFDRPTLAAPGIATLYFAGMGKTPSHYDVARDGSILQMNNSGTVQWSRDGVVTKSVSLDAFKRGDFNVGLDTPVVSDGAGGAFVSLRESHFQTPPPLPVPGSWLMVARGAIVHILADQRIDTMPLFDGAVAPSSNVPSARILHATSTTVRLVLRQSPGGFMGGVLLPKNPAGPTNALIFADFDLATRSIRRVWHFEDAKCIRHGDHYFESAIEAGSTIIFSAGRPMRDALIARCGDAHFADLLTVSLATSP